MFLAELMEDASMQLTNSSFGILQVYHEGFWGFLCYARVEDSVCALVCQQAGFE